MTYSWHDLLGNIGVVLLLATYWLLQAQKMSPKGWLFSAANGLGALFVLVSLTQEFNLSAFVMELVWLLVSGYGLRTWYLRRRTDEKSLNK